MVQILSIGIGAGAAAALLFATLASGSAFSIFLFYLTPLPILLAGIAWSQLTGLIAAVAAAALLGYALGRWFFLSFLVAIGIPAYTLSYLALLARDDNGDGTLEWFPAGTLVIAAALLAALATALTVPALGLDIDTYRNTLKDGFERVLRAQTGTPAGQPLQLPGGRDTKQVLDLLAIIMPPFAALMTMGTSLLNLWLAGRIARTSGRLQRPWPDLNELRFPNFTPLLFAIIIALTFLPGIAGLIASLFGATLLFAYVLMGFAVIHHITRPMGARFIILAGVWTVMFMFGWTLLIVALIGLADPIFNFRQRFAGTPPAPTNPSE
jgi:hypothetical protein